MKIERYLKRVCLFAILLSMIQFSVSCNARPVLCTYTSADYFDTVSIVKYYSIGDEQKNEIRQNLEEMMKKYDSLFDIYEPKCDNGLKAINDNAGICEVKTDGELIELLKFAKEANGITHGKINVAMGSVISIWHNCMEYAEMNPDEAKLPSYDELYAASLHTDIDCVKIDEEQNTVYISDKECSLDFGAVAKGFVSEKIAGYFMSENIGGVINIGGNIRTVGRKIDGSSWYADIEDPDGDLLDMQTELNDMSLVTSGSYQRYYTVDGKKYHHIIDNETLFPKNEYSSVSVKCRDATLADAMSTALFNMSEDEGYRLVESIEGLEALWIKYDGEIIKSKGF